MKKDLHPSDYRFVVFQDEGAKFSFLTRSTATTNETTTWEDGEEYPLIKTHISSASHPFYTGEQRVLDIEGRVDKFEARRKAAVEKREAATNKARKNVDRVANRAKKTEKAAAAKPNAGDDALDTKTVKTPKPEKE